MSAKKRKPGGGRKKTGRTVATKSVTLKHETWRKLDEQRGNKSRGKYIEPVLDEHFKNASAQTPALKTPIP